MSYEISKPNNYVIMVEPKVSFETWFGFSNLPVKATFDFSKIPVELHQSLLIALYNQYNNSSRPHQSTELRIGYIGQIFKFIGQIFKRKLK